MDDAASEELRLHVEEHGLRCELVQRDSDAKYVDSFDSVFKSMGAKSKGTTHQSPILQAFVERVVQTLEYVMLNAFCIVNEQQLAATQFYLQTTENFCTQGQRRRVLRFQYW